jgi:glutamine---fructose-6-phosphate transaminase (isomerizing)
MILRFVEQKETAKSITEIGGLNTLGDTMNSFYLDIQQQPEALRRFVAHHSASNADTHHTRPRRPDRVLLTGMGASYHVALWASYLLQTLDIWAVAIESSDLIHFSSSLLKGVDQVVFISQSGASAEVLPFVKILPPTVELTAITNDPESPLATSAQMVRTLEAGDESTVATRTYVNSMACMWLLAHEWQRSGTDDHSSTLIRLADRMAQILANAGAIATLWLEQMSSVKQLFFLGHGPHLPTARQSAMMIGEWAKHASIGTSIGAFRHGLIEIVDGDTGIVILGSGGMTDSSTELLADELRSYGANVLMIVEGQTASTHQLDHAPREFDEMLGSLLDVIPAQLFAEALARHLQITYGFRHIGKVVGRL